VIKPAYSVSFLLSINIFVWQNVLYFPNDPHILDKSCRENQNTHFMFSNFFFPKTVPFMRGCGKLLYSQTGHRWLYGSCPLHAVYLRLQTRILRICNSYCFSMTTSVAQMHRSVTFTCMLPVLFWRV